jgi:hypothetical protein
MTQKNNKKNPKRPLNTTYQTPTLNQWEQFQSSIATKLNNFKIEYSINTLSVHTINEHLTQIIINNAKKFFKIKKIIPQTKHNLPISIRKIENNKSYINNTITHLSIYKQLLLNEISLNDKKISSSFNITKFWNITQQKKLFKFLLFTI